jgi:hypothetical protein
MRARKAGHDGHAGRIDRRRAEKQHLALQMFAAEADLQRDAPAEIGLAAGDGQFEDDRPLALESAFELPKEIREQVSSTVPKRRISSLRR